MHKKDFIQAFVIRCVPGDEASADQAIAKAELAWSVLSINGYGDAKRNGKKSEAIPVQKVVDAYHHILPTLPKVAAITDKRRSSIETRWRKGMNTLSQWEQYFNYVSESDFLMGKVKPWKASIDFLIRESTLVQMMEGKYHG